jgi:hypothetical protein
MNWHTGKSHLVHTAERATEQLDSNSNVNCKSTSPGHTLQLVIRSYFHEHSMIRHTYTTRIPSFTTTPPGSVSNPDWY